MIFNLGSLAFVLGFFLHVSAQQSGNVDAEDFSCLISYAGAMLMLLSFLVAAWKVFKA